MNADPQKFHGTKVTLRDLPAFRVSRIWCMNVRNVTCGPATERVLDRAAEWHSNCQRENWSSESLDWGEGENRLCTIFVIFLVMWVLGLVASYTLGGFIHILLIIAIAVALI